MQHYPPPPPGPSPLAPEPAGQRRLTLLGYIVVFAVAVLIADWAYGGPGVMFMLLFGVPIVVGALIIRALVRVGDKPPAPVVINPPAVVGPPPGWYPDPAGAADMMRWFDGRGWTEFKRAT